MLGIPAGSAFRCLGVVSRPIHDCAPGHGGPDASGDDVQPGPAAAPGGRSEIVACRHRFLLRSPGTGALLGARCLVHSRIPGEPADLSLTALDESGLHPRCSLDALARVPQTVQDETRCEHGAVENWPDIAGSDSDLEVCVHMSSMYSITDAVKVSMRGPCTWDNVALRRVSILLKCRVSSGEWSEFYTAKRSTERQKGGSTAQWRML